MSRAGKNLKPSYAEQGVASSGSPTECICPMCRKRYVRYTYWTGNGTPRIYCHSCEQCDLGSELEEYRCSHPLEGGGWELP
jgi:hypothetical protein